MNYKKHFRQNYKIVKERMLEKNKGFWKVQSIHKLKLKLSTKYNTQDYLMLKVIQNSPKISPSFISFSNDTRYSQLFKKRLNKIKGKLSKKTQHNIFITNENQKKKEDSKYKEHQKQLYINFYKDFSYEPYLYNELQFIYLKGKDKMIPRKFSEVLKDCFIMDKYNKALNKMNYKTLSSSVNKENDYGINNIKLTDSNIDNFNNIRSLDAELRKKNMKLFNHNLKINTNYSNTAYDGFFKSKKSEGVYTLPTLDI